VPSIASRPEPFRVRVPRFVPRPCIRGVLDTYLKSRITMDGRSFDALGATVWLASNNASDRLGPTRTSGAASPLTQENHMRSRRHSILPLGSERPQRTYSLGLPFSSKEVLDA
jgi:hypothetical protein